jgi:HSP20 family protein
MRRCREFPHFPSSFAGIWPPEAVFGKGSPYSRGIRDVSEFATARACTFWYYVVDDNEFMRSSRARRGLGRRPDDPGTGGLMSTKLMTRIPSLESFSPLSTMPARFRTLFGDSFQDAFAPSVGWVPSVEVTEKGEDIIVSCELPGMVKEDVEIVLQNNVLTIRGEKKEERKEESESKRYLVYERNYGSFSRSFSLPTNVSADKVNASFSNGVLTIHLPKTAESKDRLIPIKNN